MSLEDIDDAYPLTQVQKGMLFHVLSSPDSDVYVSYLTLAVSGPLDLSRFRQAWQETYARHESLRSAFIWDGLDEPLQVVRSSVEIPWEYCQWSQESTSADEAKLAELIATHRQRPFDLEQAPLSRMVLIEHDHQNRTLLWVIHHLLADGWSTPIILKDVMRAYGRPTSLKETSPGMRFAAFVAWADARDRTMASAYWQQMLGEAMPSPLKLARPGQNESANDAGTGIPDVRLKLSLEQTEQLTAFAQRSRLTLSTLVHGAWALILRQVCDSDEPVFGSTTSGRSAGLPGMDEAVGMFLNTLPVCAPITDNQPLADWLSSLQSSLQKNAANDALPLSEIQRLVPREEGDALFDSIVVIEGHSADIAFASDDGALQFHGLEYATHSNYPLALLAFPGVELELAIVYEGSQFFHADIDRILSGLVTVLCSFVGAGDQALAHWAGSMSDQAELVRINTGQSKAQSPHSRIEQWFGEHVRLSPDAIAVSFADASVTYRELDRKIDQFESLIRQECQPLPPVIGLMEPRSVDLIAVMFGILRAGAAYLPIDPDYPTERVRAVLASASVAAVCARKSHRALLAAVGVTVVAIESAGAQSSSIRSRSSEVPSEVAYVIYTSGSTGASKGVPITHRQLLYSTDARMAHYGETKPTFLLLSSISFDSSVAGIYWALCSGGRLVLPEPGEERDIASLATIIQTQQVTHTLALPSLYNLLIQYASQESLASLQCVIVAGESFPPALVQRHFEHLSQTRLFNEYGPTEACVWSSVHEFKQTDVGPIPIGKPIGSTRLLILNRHRRPSPIGVEGEIAIGGAGVASGYLNDPKLTQDRFFESPFAPMGYPVLYSTGDLGYWRDDGCLMFTGRKDRQVKIRGYRIEPGEIETVIQEFAAVEEALVTTRSAGDTRLSTQLLALPADESEALLTEIEGLSDMQIRSHPLVGDL